MLLSVPDLHIILGAAFDFLWYRYAMYLLMQSTMYVTFLAQTQASWPSLWASELLQTHDMCFGCTYIRTTRLCPPGC